MPGKHFDLDIDNQLGGTNASNVYVPSQKAIKDYVDNTVPNVADTYSATSEDAMSGIAVAEALANQKNVTFRIW